YFSLCIPMNSATLSVSSVIILITTLRANYDWHLGLVARPRCGVELIADLEFVCGDRGFYRGRARNGGSRSRGNGIVEQCCIKGCDLQHLEQYCAKPSRGRRQPYVTSTSPHSPTSPLRALTALRHLYEPSQPYVTSTSPHSPTSPLRALTALRHLYEPSQPYVTSTSPHSPTSPLRALTALRHLYEPSQPCVTSTSPHSSTSPLRALTPLYHVYEPSQFYITSMSSHSPMPPLHHLYKPSQLRLTIHKLPPQRLHQKHHMAFI
uniref:Insulin-like domain-containing protein n=1 Tax=Electrophorus electricus TaxID=8005 RepID=A0AAY5ET35_ELEEL